MSKETEGATEESVAEEKKGSTEEAWDEDRAKATILKQRQAEKDAKSEIATLKKKLDGFTSEEDKKAEANKSLEVKVSERDATIKTQEDELAALHVKQDFENKAFNNSIADVALAYLAAKEQGLLGEFDPKTGQVSDHDFEELGEKYPSFKGKVTGQTGDAGVRSRGKAATVNEQFNDTIRRRMSRL